MPDSSIPVYGGTAQQKARVQAFLKTVGVKVKPSSVVIVPSGNFKQTAKAMAANDTDWGFTLAGANRVYINDAAFGQQHPNPHYSGPEFPEFILSHELAHMNSSAGRATQEANEVSDIEHNRPNRFDVVGSGMLQKWQKQGGAAYSQAQQLIASTPGKIQPQPAQIATQLLTAKGLLSGTK